MEWNCLEIIHWLNRVGSGALNDIKYQALRKHIQSANLRGCELGNINDVALKLIGIQSVQDRKLILNHVFDLVSGSQSGCGVEIKSIDIDQKVPGLYCDPITHELMKDPVLVTVSGHTYERTV